MSSCQDGDVIRNGYGNNSAVVVNCYFKVTNEKVKLKFNK